MHNFWISLILMWFDWGVTFPPTSAWFILELYCTRREVCSNTICVSEWRKPREWVNERVNRLNVCYWKISEWYEHAIQNYHAFYFKTVFGNPHRFDIVIYNFGSSGDQHTIISRPKWEKRVHDVALDSSGRRPSLIMHQHGLATKILFDLI